MKTEVVELVQSKLDQIAGEHGVNVLFACESGSRAWGFASEDSDYDVRFIYSRPINKYVTLAKIHGQIDKHFKDNIGEFDFVGWDIKKALTLFKASNPQLMEWLQSPVVYKDDRGLRSMLSEHLPTIYDRESCFYHYYSMAKNNFKEYVLKSDTAKIKKYFYILRSLWACHRATSINHDLPIPIEFDVLRLLPNSGKPEGAINMLLELKVDRNAEHASIARSAELDDYIMSELCRLEEFKVGWFDKHEHRPITPEKWREREDKRIAQLDEIFWQMVT